MKAKQIHLDETTIEILTIDAIKNKSTFKIHAQAILTTFASRLIHNQKQYSEIESNAKLIASAPEMFEMLKRIENTKGDIAVNDAIWIEMQQLLTKITE